MRELEYDFVVIGTGLAGLVAAWHAAGYGKVALISKSQLDISKSYNAQGGVAAAMGSDDAPALHFDDTLTAGRGLCDHDAVEILVNEGVDCVKQMIDSGIHFDCDPNGKIILGLEGGHSRRRILHADGDATGRVMTNFMIKKITGHPNITAFEYTSAIQLLVEDEICMGVQTLNYFTDANELILAKATILATGGLSRLYTRSTNPYTATGDGIALAWQAGAKLADMEFIQFHPTALSLAGHDAYLISEAVRGEGAILVDQNGERFMKSIHPLAELAPRDVVAASIFRQMQKTNAPVYLSLKHLDGKFISERFHSISDHLKELRIDMTRDLVPVAPAAHYMVGGIRTDLWGQTNITGLFACGEVASTGVMGANRLASNSLLECLVYGKRVVEKARYNNQLRRPTQLPGQVHLSIPTDNLFLSVKNELALLMTNEVGIVRNKDGMEKALMRINEIEQQFNAIQGNYNLLKIRNLTDICRLITQSAILREESRGGHIRTDFPEESPDQLHHIIQRKENKTTYENVRISKL